MHLADIYAAWIADKIHGNLVSITTQRPMQEAIARGGTETYEQRDSVPHGRKDKLKTEESRKQPTTLTNQKAPRIEGPETVHSFECAELKDTIIKDCPRMKNYKGNRGKSSWE
ncbi:hypothetical protein Tco_0592820 [Tanacetum coccineum]